MQNGREPDLQQPISGIRGARESAGAGKRCKAAADGPDVIIIEERGREVYVFAG